MKYGEILMLPSADLSTVKIYGGDNTIYELNINEHFIIGEEYEISYDKFKAVPVYHCGKVIFAGEEQIVIT